MKKTLLLILCLFFVSNFSFAEPFNSKLTEEDLNVINSGEVLIKNINFKRNMSLNEGVNQLLYF